MKKYLTQTSMTDNREAAEYKLFAGFEDFYIIISNQRDGRRLDIPYKNFQYPQFITEEAIFEELEKRIRKFFKVEGDDKVNLLCYSKKEQSKIQRIVLKNKVDFEL